MDKKRQDPTARSVPYLRVANVQRGYLDLAEVKLIEAAAADIAELRLVPGDVLFNEGGDRDKLGRGWIWEGQLPECIHQNHVFRARLHSEELSGKLISWWGNTFGKDYFLREGKQTTNLASINRTKLAAFPVPLLLLAEQDRIVAERQPPPVPCPRSRRRGRHQPEACRAVAAGYASRGFRGRVI